MKRFITFGFVLSADSVAGQYDHPASDLRIRSVVVPPVLHSGLMTFRHDRQGERTLFSFFCPNSIFLRILSRNGPGGSPNGKLGTVVERPFPKGCQTCGKREITQAGTSMERTLSEGRDAFGNPERTQGTTIEHPITNGLQACGKREITQAGTTIERPIAEGRHFCGKRERTQAGTAMERPISDGLQACG